ILRPLAARRRQNSQAGTPAPHSVTGPAFGQADIELVLSAERPHCLRVKLVSRLWRWLPPAVLLGASALAVARTPGPDYAIVVSRATQADRDWRRVVEVLREKHRGAVIVFDASVEEAQPKLRALF